MRCSLAHLGLSLLTASSLAYPHYQSGWKTRAVVEDNVASAYDYVVVGGGQSALVIANRLSEEESSSVLVVEYGYFADDAQLEPSSAKVWLPQYLYNLTSAPQPGIGNKSVTVWSAAVVGGGSAINGMMLNRGSADEYNNWARLGNPGWAFEDLLPYFIKGTKFQRPSPQLEQEFGITWDESVYGTDGPIHNSFAPFQWPGTKHQWQAFVESGAEPQIDGGDGNAYGVYWYKSAVDNTTVTRSYARTGYYDPIQDRENLHLLTGWRVNEVLFDEEKHATGVTIQSREDNSSAVSTIKANKEVIVCAGALHSPAVLQRSGIGPAGLLDQAGIDVVVDLPGVGSNLQDHPTLSTSYSYTKNVWPNPGSLNNASFAEWAEQAWEQNRTGPYSQTVGNAAAYLPLRLVAGPDDAWRSIHDTYLTQDAAAYLPPAYTPSQVAGYEAQRELLADAMTRDDNAALEFTFNAGSTFPLILNKPLSRGTVLLNLTSTRDAYARYADPVVDFHALHNPLDVTVLSESLGYARRVHDTPTMKKVFAPRELTPGSNVTGSAELAQYVRANAGASAAHLSGTCAMMPRELGGVVAPDLTVYGVTGLSVADASVMPLIPGAHTCASVYAVAEKAADLIKARHK